MCCCARPPAPGGGSNAVPPPPARPQRRSCSHGPACGVCLDMLPGLNWLTRLHPCLHLSFALSQSGVSICTSTQCQRNHSSLDSKICCHSAEGLLPRQPPRLRRLGCAPRPPAVGRARGMWGGCDMRPAGCVVLRINSLWSPPVTRARVAPAPARAPACKGRARGGGGRRLVSGTLFWGAPPRAPALAGARRVERHGSEAGVFAGARCWCVCCACSMMCRVPGGCREVAAGLLLPKVCN
jgi:hypothetical protein